VRFDLIEVDGAGHGFSPLLMSVLPLSFFARQLNERTAPTSSRTSSSDLEKEFDKL
jgi:hypothetical protein